MLVTTKLHAPAVREQTIPRDHLVRRIASGAGLKLTLIACPAGFGKTTLLAGWLDAESDRRPVAWLSLDEADSDPVVLWSYVIEALRRASPPLREALPSDAGPAPLIEIVLPRLINALAEQGEVALVLDDFHRLKAGPALDSIAWFIEHTPATFHLIVATRTEPTLPLPTLRAHGALQELRASDLRFTREEAQEFLNDHLALGLAEEDVDGLVERTEGWPAGLYLAALSLQDVPDRRAAVRRFSASSRHVIDYVVAEVLEAHDASMQTLMLRSSVLRRLSGPLCDAVLRQQGSAAVLDALSRTNLFLIPLDDEHGWYRFHHLFAQLLRAELERREPGLASTLRARASVWHRDHGTETEAIHYAIEAGAFPEAGGLIAALWPRFANAGRYATVLAWLRRFPDEALQGDVRLLLAKAWVLSLSAQQEEAAQAIATVESLGDPGRGPLPDGFSSAESSLTTLKGVFPWGDTGAQLAQGRRAAELEGPRSRWRPLASWAVGTGLHFRGEPTEADRWFEESATLAPLSEQWFAASSSLAHRSLIAGEGGRVGEQRLLEERAAELTREHGLEDLVGATHLAKGMSLAARGRLEEALLATERGVVVLRSLGQPTGLVYGFLCQASVLRDLGRCDRLQAVVSEARSILERCADPGILAERLADLERAWYGAAEGNGGLTRGELRVLRLLDGALSERDIGAELYVSHNTVHSHIRSIYRKLEVSSRADAVARALDLGLLQPSDSPR